jgi:hypothetical protein
MHLISKGALTIGLFAAAALSQAISYSNIDATVTFDGTTTYNLQVLVDGNSITFTGIPPMTVIQPGTHSTAVVNISYDVTSKNGLNGLDLIYTGSTFGTGTIDWNESVMDSGSNVIGTASGSESGDSAFSREDFISFSGGAVNAYSVNKTFTLDVGGQTPSAASLGLIEQNAVPEPASMGALAIGALGLLSKRRRK